MKRVLIAIILLLVSSTAQAQTYPSCAQLPLLACAAGDTISGTFTFDETAGATPIIFEGATANDYETTLTIGDPTADRAFFVPGDANSAAAKAVDCSAGNHVDSFDPATGAFACTADSGATHTVLDGSVHTDTVAQTVSRGSLIYGNSTPAWDELTIGAANTFLHSNGTDAAWASIGASDIGAGDLANALTWAEVCTQSGGTCTLANAPRVSSGCSSDGSGGSILAFSNGLQMKCVDATPGINEFTLSSTTFTFGDTGNSPALVYYER